MFNSCALTLISPGVNSNFRLKKIVDIRFQEAHFYGLQFYNHSSFFIEKENFTLIITDPNNQSFNKNEFIPSLFYKDNQVYILFENCYEKEKIEDPFYDIRLYQFYLNKIPSLNRYSYFYPYSYNKKGTVYLKKNPFLIYNSQENRKEIIRTGDDFLACIRTINTFEKRNLNNGMNYFQVMTSNRSHLEYSFEFKDKFVYFNEEPVSFGVGSRPNSR